MRDQLKSNPGESALQVSPSAIRTLHYARKSKHAGVGMPIYPNAPSLGQTTSQAQHHFRIPATSL